MENNTLLSDELEQMRTQIGMIKQKLEQQAIVNDTHIRNSMKSKISDLNRTVLGTIFAGIFAVVFAPMTFYIQGCSLLFVIGTAVMLAVCLVLTIAQKINLSRMTDLSQSNLVETAERLNKTRTHYKEWYRIAIPMLLVWVGWMIYEMVNTIGIESPTAIGFYCGAGVGLLIGGIIGSRINRKVVRQANEILAQIEELQQS
jgi:protein-S-isoprenylcysteine O-methyltransferase Ste14